MKVLMVHELSFFDGFGGGEIYLKEMAENLSNFFKIYVVAGSKRPTQKIFLKKFILHLINYKPFRYFLVLKLFFYLLKIIPKFRPDIIHASTYVSAIPAYLAAKIFRIPIILIVHNLFFEEWKNYFNIFKSLLFQLAEKIIFSLNYDLIIVPDKNAEIKIKILNKKSKIVYIPYPINTSLFKRRKRIKRKKIIIGSVGRFYDKTKSFESILHVIEKFKNNKKIEFWIGGKLDKNSEKKLKKIKNVRIFGIIKHEKINKFYNSLDLFIGQGIAAKEAIACGCITILNEKTRRLLNYHKPEIKNGIMFIESPERIIASFLKNRKKFEKIRKKGEKFIKKNYDIQQIIKQYIVTYHQLLSKR